MNRERKKICPVMVWCGESFPAFSNVRRTPKTGFFNSLNITFMYPPVNLSAMEELLTEIYSPRDLAYDLDEIAFDYARTLVELRLLDVGESIFINLRAGEFINTLRELSEAIRACEIKQ